MQFTGERIIPKENCGNIHEHVTLYQRNLNYVENKFVLDIACGVGWGTELLAKGAKFVIGVDVDAPSIEYAKKEYTGDNFRFVQGSILSIPFPDQLFDVVNSIETFEHVKRYEIETLVSECYRVLKPGGLFIFSTPDGSQFEYQPKNETEYVGYHFWHYTKDELEKLLAVFSRVNIQKYEQDSSSFYVICKK